MRGVQALVWMAALATGVVVGGCASSRPGAPFEPEVLEPGRAVIYVFRMPKTFGSRLVSVVVNQETVGRLHPGEYLAHEVDPGEYLVRVEGASEVVQRVQLGAGESSYLRVVTRPLSRNRPTLDAPEQAKARDMISRTSRALGP